MKQLERAAWQVQLQQIVYTVRRQFMSSISRFIETDRQKKGPRIITRKGAIGLPWGVLEENTPNPVLNASLEGKQ
jgi:hypothetical protein